MTHKTGGMAVALLAFLIPPAWGFEFSGQRITKAEGKVVTVHVNAREDRWRFEYAEPQSGAMAAIIRLDRQSAWLILSIRRIYAEVPIAPAHLLLVSEKMEGEVVREFIGTEDLNGYPTELFDVTVLIKGEPKQFYQWVTKDQRFCMKMVSKRGDWSVEYQHVKFVPQPDRYFEPPIGFRGDHPVNPAANPPLAN